MRWRPSALRLAAGGMGIRAVFAWLGGGGCAGAGMGTVCCMTAGVGGRIRRYLVQVRGL